jgi:hypothetical protein
MEIVKKGEKIKHLKIRSGKTYRECGGSRGRYIFQFQYEFLNGYLIISLRSLIFDLEITKVLREVVHESSLTFD